MSATKNYDAVIIGSGPNGLSAGICLAGAGLKVLILEAAPEPGGGMRTKTLTLPGFRHDVCSAVHPIGYMSPFFRSLNLDKYGLDWIFPEASVAHPLDGDRGVILSRSVRVTAENLGVDREAYRRLLNGFSANAATIAADVLDPWSMPQNPRSFIRFGLKAWMPATTFSKHYFRGPRARALFAGCVAHSVLPFDKFFTTAFGLLFFILGHGVDWPLPKGGSQAIARALVRIFEEREGEIQLHSRVQNFGQLPRAKAYLFDTDPIQLAEIAGDQLPHSYCRRLRNFHYGPGAFKIDYALSEAIPWKDPRCRKASTVHLGGSFAEIASSEKAAWQGRHHEKPFVLLTQQSLFDPTRSPAGQHTCWAYCHVPYGSIRNMSEAIEKQIERFAPGFKDIILARHYLDTAAYQDYNPNYRGGVIGGGAVEASQLFFRPVWRIPPYTTPNPNIFICSASTPPGAGVHGMCGYHAARWVLHRVFQKKV